jgi:3-oxoadipate enol-lactonase
MPIVHNGEVRIHYDVRGDGPPLVMLYGLGGHSRDWWDEFPALLSRRFRLYMVDNRGTGESDKPREPWSMVDMAGDLLAVVDHAGLDRFHLLGCSLGSIIARQFVMTHGGDRILSLSLLCPPNGIPATPEDQRAAIEWDPALPPIESARKSWRIIHPEPWVTENDGLLVSKLTESLKDATPARTFRIQLQAAVEAGEVNSAVNSYDWPVLILHGDGDRLVPPANAATLSTAIPRARLELLPGCSHNFWNHAPGPAAAIVENFLVKVPLPGRSQ